MGETSHRTPQRREVQEKIILKGDDSLQLVVPAMVALNARFEEAQADGDVARKLQQGCLECRMRLVRLLGQGHELATGSYTEAAFLPEMMWPFLHDTDDLPLSAPCYLAAYGQYVGGVSVGQNLCLDAFVALEDEIWQGKEQRLALRQRVSMGCF